jgi:sugar lactone lactonase YvrE
MVIPVWAVAALSAGVVVGAAAGTLVLTTSGPFSDHGSPTAQAEATPSPAAVSQDADVQTITGGPSFEGPTQEGPPGVARFGTPGGLAVGQDGTIYISDFKNHVVLKIDASGLTTRLAGSGAQGVKDGPATEAEFFGPQDLAVAEDGTIYVADGYGNRVRKITKDGQVSTVAGGGDFGLGKGSFQDGVGDKARFDGVAGIQLDGDGNLLVTDYTNNRIRRVTTDGEVTTLAGAGVLGHRDGAASQALFALPSGLAIGPDGTIWVTEHGNNDVRAISPGGMVQTVLARTTPLTAEAAVSYPSGVGVSPDGEVYICDTQGHRIIRLYSDGRTEVVAGGGSAGFADGPSMTAKFSSPSSVAVDAAGNLIVTDRENSAVRRIVLQ